MDILQTKYCQLRLLSILQIYCQLALFLVNLVPHQSLLIPSNSHLIFHGPHKSTESIYRDMTILPSLNGNFLYLTTLVNFVLLYVVQVAVIFLYNVVKPGQVKFTRTLSSNLLASVCCRLIWYHPSRSFLKVVGS